jgi:hypothetical protein
MLTSAHEGGCVQCSGRIVDAGEEYVCSSCGIVMAKVVTDSGEDRGAAGDRLHDPLAR